MNNLNEQTSLLKHNKYQVETINVPCDDIRIRTTSLPLPPSSSSSQRIKPSKVRQNSFSFTNSTQFKNFTVSPRTYGSNSSCTSSSSSSSNNDMVNTDITLHDMILTSADVNINTDITDSKVMDGMGNTTTSASLTPVNSNMDVKFINRDVVDSSYITKRSNHHKLSVPTSYGYGEKMEYRPNTRTYSSSSYSREDRIVSTSSFSEENGIMRNTLTVLDVNDVNPDSQHVREVIHKHKERKERMRKKDKKNHDEYVFLEMRLINSIIINDQLKTFVRDRIAHFIRNHKETRIPLVAFIKCSNQVYRIYDYDQFSSLCSYIKPLSDAIPISEDQLSLDLLQLEESYRVIVSIILYLQSLKLTFIISRHKIQFEFMDSSKSIDQLIPQPNPNNQLNTVSSLVNRIILYQNLRCKPNGGDLVDQFMRWVDSLTKPAYIGYYYVIIVDLSRTIPSVPIVLHGGGK